MSAGVNTSAGRDRPRVSVVIPALGNYVVLGRVLDGFGAQTGVLDHFEVIVVADRAERRLEHMRETIGTRPYPVRLLSGRSPGASANRNVGWEAARAGIVLFTDSDTIPVPELVSQHLTWHQRHPADEVVVTGPVRWSPEVAVSPFMRWLEEGIQFNFGTITGDRAQWTHVYSANCSIKRTFLERVGGYDEERLPYGYEDLDWAYRARALGLQVLYNRSAVTDHLRTMSPEHWIARAPRLAVSEWSFCEKHPDFEPWFHRLFKEAAGQPPAGGGAARLARWVPRRVPWLGQRIWRRADLHWRQRIAPPFLDTWDALAAGSPVQLESAASARAERGEPSAG